MKNRFRDRSIVYIMLGEIIMVANGELLLDKIYLIRLNMRKIVKIRLPYLKME